MSVGSVVDVDVYERAWSAVKERVVVHQARRVLVPIRVRVRYFETCKIQTHVQEQVQELLNA